MGPRSVQLGALAHTVGGKGMARDVMDKELQENAL
jgi:hypothetical protein